MTRKAWRRVLAIIAVAVFFLLSSTPEYRQILGCNNQAPPIQFDASFAIFSAWLLLSLSLAAEMNVLLREKVLCSALLMYAIWRVTDSFLPECPVAPGKVVWNQVLASVVVFCLFSISVLSVRDIAEG